MKSCLHPFGYWCSFSVLPSRKLTSKVLCSPPAVNLMVLEMFTLACWWWHHCTAIVSIPHPPPQNENLPVSPTAMKSHFGRFSASSTSHHWASVKWTKSVYLSSETLLFPHEFSLNIVMLLLHSSIQQMENKFILVYFLNIEHAAGKITGGGVCTGCMIHHWVVVKIMFHFTFTPWGKAHFTSRGNKILSLKNLGFLSTIKLHLRDVTDTST